MQLLFSVVPHSCLSIVLFKSFQAVKLPYVKVATEYLMEQLKEWFHTFGNFQKINNISKEIIHNTYNFPMFDLLL